MDCMHSTPRREPWNKGKLVGQKAPLKLKDIWAIRVRLQMQVIDVDIAWNSGSPCVWMCSMIFTPGNGSTC